MRQIDVLVKPGKGKEALEIAERHGGINMSLWTAESASGGRDRLTVNLPNNKVEDFIAEIDRFEGVELNLVPQGYITLYPPSDRAPEQAISVQHLSPIEVFLSAMQSIGSWTSFIGYSIAAAIIVWTGLYTNTIYLLIAAMLIAPYAGPAMNIAIGTARGDAHLIRQSLIRYFVSLSLTVAVAALLSIAMGLQIATNMMVTISKLSVIYALLPLAAGAAGALNLMQSERNSLVSGAAVGLLVSVSLAPPAGLVGMAMTINRWDLVTGGVFALLTTILAINLGGALVFRLYGLSSKGARYSRGKKLVTYMAAAITFLALVSLVVLQVVSPPELQRLTREERVDMIINNVIDDSGLARPIESDVSFTRSEPGGNNTLLATVYVERYGNVTMSVEEIKKSLTDSIQARLLEEEFNLLPLIDVTVLEGPQRQVGA